MGGFKQGINIPALLTVGAISIILLIVLVLGTQAWFQSEDQEEQTVKATNGMSKSEYADLKDTQKADMQKYGWMDANKTVAQVPIEQAMKMIVTTGGKLPSTQPTGG